MSDIVQRLKDSRSSMNRIMLTEAADEITRLRTALSEAEQREKDARRWNITAAEWHMQQSEAIKQEMQAYTGACPSQHMSILHSRWSHHEEFSRSLRALQSEER